MKRLGKLLPLLLFVGGFVLFASRDIKSIPRSSPGSKPALVSAEAEETGHRGVEGPDLEKWYFEKWHQPYGSVLPPDLMEQIWSEVERTPSEGQSGSLPVNSWSALGPYGQNVVYGGVAQGARYSGRILDIEVNNGVSTRLAAASGGLWGFFLFFPIPLSDQVTSLAVGSFASKPGDANTIYVGTGEPQQRGGTGLWKTVNGGTTWTHVPLSPEPSGIYRVRFTPDNANKIHVASNTGYYHSTDGGVTWTRTLVGDCTDLLVCFDILNLVYTAKWGDGLYQSTDGGNTWSKVTAGGIPTTNVGRTAICAPNNPSYMYVSMAKNDDNSVLGVYRTVNGGTTWTNVTPPSNFLGGQGWYDNVISCSPVSYSNVLVGGVTLWRSVNGGTNWTQISDVNVHADQHAITWSSDGGAVWVGNDGGMSYSGDAGASWSTSGNLCPITQYVNFGNAGDAVIFGGSQDNGYSGTTDRGTTWEHTLGGDGGGITIDPSNPSRIFGTLGVYGGNWAFQRHRSTDMGQNWVGINNGIDPSGQWYHKIRNDRVTPVYLYNNSGPYVYRSLDYGDSWAKLNTTAFPSDVYNMTITRYPAVVYACLAAANPPPYTGRLLEVYDGSTWYERSAGLPTSVYVRGVATHPTDNNKAYALMTGFTAGQKVFKTTDKGVSWTNITGDLPNVPLGDLVPHPTDDNKLYLGTEMGCYRTTNGGVNWQRWNNGMPPATIVTEMSYIDSSAINGKYYVLAATYGRGIWKRDISGDDPVGVKQVASLPDAYTLMQNYPNPFNPSTVISFTLPKEDVVELKVFDITGREVSTLVHEKLQAGTHSYTFDASRLASGTYLYRMTTSGYTQVKKMLVIK